MIMTPGDTVTAADVALFLGGAPLSPPPAPARAQDYGDLSFKEARRRFEADYLQARLDENDGNMSRTAEQIGMERSHLHKKVKALGIVVR